jgi:hypothetical protein
MRPEAVFEEKRGMGPNAGANYTVTLSLDSEIQLSTLTTKRNCEMWKVFSIGWAHYVNRKRESTREGREGVGRGGSRLCVLE